MVKHHPSPLNREDLLQPNCRNDDLTGFMLTGMLTLWLHHLEECLGSPKGGETAFCIFMMSVRRAAAQRRHSDALASPLKHESCSI